VIYFDAAYIAKCYLNEAGAEQIIDLASGSDGLSCCEYGRLEFLCALQRHLREGFLTKAQFLRVVKDFEQDEADGVWHWFPVTSALIRHVCRQVQGLPNRVFLRAGDALHLGCAGANEFKEIYSNDRHLLAAAEHFGLTGINILNPQGSPSAHQ
jgi:predicted nucleic acid-binding protein